MTAYTSAREALLRDLESAQNALKGAEEAYEKAQRAAAIAQAAATRAYDGRARNSQNVDRLQKAIAILDGGDE